MRTGLRGSRLLLIALADGASHTFWVLVHINGTRGLPSRGYRSRRSNSPSRIRCLRKIVGVQRRTLSLFLTDKGMPKHQVTHLERRREFSLCRCTGIDGYNSAGDIAGLFAEQVFDRTRHILDFGEPSQRSAPHDLFSLFLGKSMCHFGC